MTVYAREPIKSGEVIYHSYSQLLVPTNLRRLLLLMGKHFGCACRRCTDPTELGSLASGVSCKKCHDNRDGGGGGVMLPECPIDIHSAWRCGKCAATSPGMEVSSFWGCACQVCQCKYIRTQYSIIHKFDDR